MRTRITLAFAAIVLLGAVGYGATIAIAQEGDGERHPFVQMLARLFGSRSLLLCKFVCAPTALVVCRKIW